MTTPLVTLEDVKAHLSVGDGVTEYDERLTALIASATSMLENYTRQKFLSAAQVDDFDTRHSVRSHLDLFGDSSTGLKRSSDPQRFVLSRGNVAASPPVDVRFDPRRLFGTETIIAAENYILDSERGVLRLLSGTVVSVSGLRVSYTAGFASGGLAPESLSEALPDDLKMACVTQVLFMWTKLRSDNIGRVMDDTSREQKNKWVDQSLIPAEVRSMLSPYRRILMGKN